MTWQPRVKSNIWKISDYSTTCWNVFTSWMHFIYCSASIVPVSRCPPKCFLWNQCFLGWRFYLKLLASILSGKFVNYLPLWLHIFILHVCPKMRGSKIRLGGGRHPNNLRKYAFTREGNSKLRKLCRQKFHLKELFTVYGYLISFLKQ